MSPTVEDGGDGRTGDQRDRCRVAVTSRRARLWCGCPRTVRLRQSRQRWRSRRVRHMRRLGRSRRLGSAQGCSCSRRRPRTPVHWDLPDTKAEHRQLVVIRERAHLRHCVGRHAAPFRSPSMAASNDVGSLDEYRLIASPLAPIRNDGVPVSPAFSAARASPAISLASSGSRRSLVQRARSRPVNWLAMPCRYASGSRRLAQRVCALRDVREQGADLIIVVY